MDPKPNPFLVASLINGGGDQTHLYLTGATAVVIFATAFLLGLCCGRGWGQRQQKRLQAAANLKRSARA
jgi:hypothetical protein